MNALELLNYLNDQILPKKGNSIMNILIDVIEEKDSFEVIASLPNVKKENIMVEYQNNKLAISVKNDSEEDNSRSKYLLRERSNRYLARVIEIPKVDYERINASYENGLLTVILPKKNGITKKIEIL